MTGLFWYFPISTDAHQKFDLDLWPWPLTLTFDLDPDLWPWPQSKVIVRSNSYQTSRSKVKRFSSESVDNDDHRHASIWLVIESVNCAQSGHCYFNRMKKNSSPLSGEGGGLVKMVNIFLFFRHCTLYMFTLEFFSFLLRFCCLVNHKIHCSIDIGIP